MRCKFELRCEVPNRNQIVKFVANFGNSEQTSEPVRQKLCETLCKSGYETR